MIFAGQLMAENYCLLRQIVLCGKLRLVFMTRSTLKVENFAGTKFRGFKKPRNFCVSRVLNFVVAPSK